MKTILGLDLGTTSIGWALVKEAEPFSDEKSEIVRLGVRVIPLTVDERTSFENGKSITTNALRTLKRGMRRNLQRYKLRRQALIEELKDGLVMTSYFQRPVQGQLSVRYGLGLSPHRKRLLLATWR